MVEATLIEVAAPEQVGHAFSKTHSLYMYKNAHFGNTNTHRRKR